MMRPFERENASDCRISNMMVDFEQNMSTEMLTGAICTKFLHTNRPTSGATQTTC